MKTTIELKGYEIVIEESEEGVTVMAVKDGETVEEFSLEAGEEMDTFGQQEEEDDFEDAEDYGDEDDEMGQDEDEDFEGESDEDEGEDEDEFEGEDEEMPSAEEDERAPKLESFSSFINKTNKRK